MLFNINNACGAVGIWTAFWVVAGRCGQTPNGAAVVRTHIENNVFEFERHGATRRGAALRIRCATPFILFTADRMDAIRAGACIDIESHITPRKAVLCNGESTLFLALSRNPFFFHVGKNDISMPNCQLMRLSQNQPIVDVVHNANTLKLQGMCLDRGGRNQNTCFANLI